MWLENMLVAGKPSVRENFGESGETACGEWRFLDISAVVDTMRNGDRGHVGDNTRNIMTT